jgi:hypothetical protein
MPNTTTALRYRDRIIEVLKELLEHREDLKEIGIDMRSKGFTDVEIAGVRLAAKRALWDEKQREQQEAIGQYALQLESEPAEAAD